MLTAHDDNDHLQAGFDAGVDDYVLKPFRREELIARVRRMLERAYGRGAVAQDDAAPAKERTAS
jgi:DNA-binding response OmpR family regulator